MKALISVVSVLLVVLIALMLVNNLSYPYNEKIGRYVAVATYTGTTNGIKIYENVIDDKELVISIYPQNYTYLGTQWFIAKANDENMQEYYYMQNKYKIKVVDDKAYIVPLTPIEYIFVMTCEDVPIVGTGSIKDDIDNLMNLAKIKEPKQYKGVFIYE